MGESEERMDGNWGWILALESVGGVGHVVVSVLCCGVGHWAEVACVSVCLCNMDSIRFRMKSWKEVSGVNRGFTQFHT